MSSSIHNHVLSSFSDPSCVACHNRKGGITVASIRSLTDGILSGNVGVRLHTGSGLTMMQFPEFDALEESKPRTLLVFCDGCEDHDIIKENTQPGKWRHANMMLTIATSLCSVEELILHGNAIAYEEVVKSLLSIPMLERVDLRHASYVSDDICKILGGLTCMTVTQIHMTCAQVPRTNPTELQSPYLLSISGLESLAMNLYSFVQGRELYLYDCAWMNEHVLYSILDKLKQLSLLAVSGLDEYTLATFNGQSNKELPYSACMRVDNTDEKSGMVCFKSKKVDVIRALADRFNGTSSTSSILNAHISDTADVMESMKRAVDAIHASTREHDTLCDLISGMLTLNMNELLGTTPIVVSTTAPSSSDMKIE